VRHHAGRFDRHWLNTLAFTLSLVGLVTLAMGANLAFAATTLATCAVGFGFFYLLFATGAYFGLVMANGLAVYVSLFAFFRDTSPRPPMPPPWWPSRCRCWPSWPGAS
jgi:hypothetical protein